MACVSDIEPIVDHIIEYLPRTTQLFIDKKRYNQISPVYHNAKNIIIRSIRYHRNRMNMIIEMEDDENLTLNMLRAHYILHYPDEYRTNFFHYALVRKIKYESPVQLMLYTVSGNWKKYGMKYMFKHIVMHMSMEELFYAGW